MSVPTISVPFTSHEIIPHCTKRASVSMSLVTRDTNTPRRGRGVFGHAQPVDVVEHADAQVAQRLLGGAHQPEVGDAADEEHADRDHDRAEAGEQHELGAEAARTEHAAVEDELDQDRDRELAERGDDREHDRRLQAVAQLGTRRQAAAQHLQRARRRADRSDRRRPRMRRRPAP